MSQAKILMLLANEREVQMSDLVRRLGISLSTMSGHVDRLVEQGFVVRRDDPADRRHVLVAATPAAHSSSSVSTSSSTAQLRRLLDHDPRRATRHRSRLPPHQPRDRSAAAQADVPQKGSSR